MNNIILPFEIINKINKLAFEMDKLDKEKAQVIDNKKWCNNFFNSMSNEMRKQGEEHDFYGFCSHMMVFDNERFY